MVFLHEVLRASLRRPLAAFGIVVGNMFMIIAGAVVPLLVGQVIALATPGGSQTELTQIVTAWAAIMVFWLLAEWVLAWSAAAILATYSDNVRTQAIESLYLDPYSQPDAGGITTRLTSDIDAIEDPMLETLIGTITDFGRLLLFGVALMLISPVIGAMFIFFLVVFIVFQFVVAKPVDRANDARDAVQFESAAVVQAFFEAGAIPADAGREEVRAVLQDYWKSAADEQWPLMRVGDNDQALQKLSAASLNLANVTLKAQQAGADKAPGWSNLLAAISDMSKNGSTRILRTPGAQITGGVGSDLVARYRQSGVGCNLPAGAPGAEPGAHRCDGHGDGLPLLHRGRGKQPVLGRRCYSVTAVQRLDAAVGVWELPSYGHRLTKEARDGLRLTKESRGGHRSGLTPPVLDAENERPPLRMSISVPAVFGGSGEPK